MGRVLFAWAALLAALPLHATTDAEVAALLRARFDGDRSGACVVAVVIDGEQRARARHCARPRTDGGPGYDTAFEIGSISKTLTALLVARLVEQGRWSLDDPVARHLPPGATVPAAGGRAIRVRELLTHSAGLPALPPGFVPADAANPYGALTEAGLLDALARTVPSAPGASSYSNFGAMLLSLAVARAHGSDLETALREQVFAPLEMRGAHVARRPGGVAPATGHDHLGAPTAAWTIATNLAGVGMVRATPEDMAQYARLVAGIGSTPLDGAMRLARQPLANGFAMNWLLRTVQGRQLVLHSGATGGFSATLMAEPGARRAVVVLADASLLNVGGLEGLALRLLGLPGPALRPRLALPMSAAMLNALPGDYELAGLALRLVARDGRLYARASGQPELELHLDDHGELYPGAVDALLLPVIEAGRMLRFAWLQGGGVVEGRRQGVASALSASNPAWLPWAGEYRLAPTFTLKIFERDGRLMLQGSGQPAFEAMVTGEDRIEVPRFGAVVEFKRVAGAPAHAAVLRQGGQVIEGPRIGPDAAAQPR